MSSGPERWFADGWELTDGYYRDIDTRDGMLDSAPMSQQVQATYVVGRQGVLQGSRWTYDQGSFTLSMWSLRSNFDDAWADYQLLLRACGAQHRLTNWQQWKASGLQIECYGRLTSATQPTQLGRLGFAVSLEVGIPAAFWQDIDETTDTTTPGSLILPLGSKALASAPMDDLEFKITGPVTNPTVQVVSDPSISDSFTFLGTIPAGAFATFDAGSWALGATGLATPTLDKVTYTGDRLLSVPPAPPGSVPTLQLSGTGTSAATALSVTGRNKYLSA